MLTVFQVIHDTPFLKIHMAQKDKISPLPFHLSPILLKHLKNEKKTYRNLERGINATQCEYENFFLIESRSEPTISPELFSENNPLYSLESCRSRYQPQRNLFIFVVEIPKGCNAHTTQLHKYVFAYTTQSLTFVNLAEHVFDQTDYLTLIFEQDGLSMCSQ